MKKRFLLVIVMFLLFTLSNFVSVRATTVEEKVYSTATIEDEFSDERVIVILNEKTSQTFKEYKISDFSEIKCKDIKVLNSAMREKLKKQLQNRTIQKESKHKTILSVDLKEKSKQNVLSVIEELQDRDDIYYVGPDYVTYAATIPNDEFYQTINIDTGKKMQWASDEISLPAAWDVTTGSSEVIVGVLDTGIKGAHSDLDDNINTALCRDFTSGSEVVVNNPTDFNGHGTMMAGVIGAEGNNSEGIAGVCWDVSLVSLKIFDDNGKGYISWIGQAIDYADRENIPLLNLSGGMRTTDTNNEEQVMYDVSIQTMINDYDGLIICAVGNHNDNIDILNNNYFPACYNNDNIIAVGATGFDNELWQESSGYGTNYGSQNVDLFAPGKSIKSTHILTSGYKSASGTSIAAPFVTGVAALILSLHPNLTSTQIKNIILTSVDVKPWLANYCVTGGRLNAEKAVKNALLHTYSYTNENVAEHKCTCTCGYTFTENHEWYLINPSATLPRYACRYCQAITTLPPVVENGIIDEEDRI